MTAPGRADSPGSGPLLRVVGFVVAVVVALLVLKFVLKLVWAVVQLGIFIALVAGAVYLWRRYGSRSR